MTLGWGLGGTGLSSSTGTWESWDNPSPSAAPSWVRWMTQRGRDAPKAHTTLEAQSQVGLLSGPTGAEAVSHRPCPHVTQNPASHTLDLQAAHLSSQLTLDLTNWPAKRRLAWHYHSHFINEAAKAQKGSETYSRPCR